MYRFAILVAAGLAAASPIRAMELTSPNISPGAPLAATQAKSGCGGENRSPALAWRDAPQATQSFALTVFDPDAHGGWWHWLVLDIPPQTTGLAQGAGSGKAALPAGALEAANSNGVKAYSGPCPPAGSGTHHYQITLWALDTPTAGINAGGDPQAVGEWLQKHNIGMTRITPVYRK